MIGQNVDIYWHWVLQSQETPGNFYSFYVASLGQFHKESVYYKIEGV